ncbi:Hypothetical_protein [Hexamita inflata]|uniref:Hypothetical_protein n=1 Tax=Hexamita inflata TaxID=28002 RepID=A0AA86UBT0_9EUKA|nr:Hypothetical protein HINF_LOCUS37064 [Hexamita inflata]
MTQVDHILTLETGYLAYKLQKLKAYTRFCLTLEILPQFKLLHYKMTYGKISLKDSWIHSRIEPGKIAYKLLILKVYMRDILSQKSIRDNLSSLQNQLRSLQNQLGSS